MDTVDRELEVLRLLSAGLSNPEIAERGTRASRHAPTDITVMRSLARCRSDLVTSEPVVAEAVGLPLVASDDDRGASDPKRHG